MKVKLFGREGSKHALDIEQDINNWLKAQPDINIIHIKQSSNGGSFQDTKLYISVWYENA